MFPMRLKVGLVTVLSCFTLLLGLLAPTGIASAHSASASTNSCSPTSVLRVDGIDVTVPNGKCHRAVFSV